MQFKTGQTVVRHDPGGHEVTFSIQGDKDAKYHEELVAQGYRYTLIGAKAEVVVDFDLPEVKGILRIHRKPLEECESCSA